MRDIKKKNGFTPAWDEPAGVRLASSQPTETPYDRLATAIVIQAVKDYGYALAPVLPGKRYKEIRGSKKRLRADCEEFFLSGWYDELTDIAPEYIFHKCMVDKRARVLKRFDKMLMKSRKPKKKKLPKWQEREIEAKRARRCLK